ncbi:MAG: hypothetical protein J0H54_02695 [Rhizobiales bacterium]|nr:hypothetical protein [Hyphomicrobiales bacterium]
MKNMVAAALLATAMTAPAFADPPANPVDHFTAGAVTDADGGFLGRPKVYLPSGKVTGAVFLFSGKDGWSATDGTRKTTASTSSATSRI